MGYLMEIIFFQISIDAKDGGFINHGQKRRRGPNMGRIFLISVSEK
jgi:hypothetical protein